MPIKQSKTAVTLVGANEKTAKRIAKKLGINEEVVLKLALLFFENSVNTPLPKR